MEIKQISAKGVVTQAIKTWDELTEEEKAKTEKLNIIKAKDYKNFRVHRNGKGELIRVEGELVVDDYFERQNRERTESQPNIMDFSASLFGKGKQKKNADKKINKALKDKNINMTPEEASERALDL